MNRVLNIHKANYTQGLGHLTRVTDDRGQILRCDVMRRENAGTVTRVHTGVLDVLHDATNDDGLAIGNDIKVGIVQFVKGVWETGERKVLDAFPDLCTIKAMGEGFTWDTQDRDRDVAAAQKAWEMAKEMIADPSYGMVILDELNIVLRYDYLDLQEVIDGLAARPEMLHVVVTGRNAKDELIEAADLVTEMEQVKHPFRSGVKAQIGVEF